MVNYHLDLTCGGKIPSRYYICVLCFLGLTLSYIMRFSLSITITEMVHPIKSKSDPHMCPTDAPPKDAHKEDKSNLYHWSEREQGIVLSSFFWGYVITMIPGGMIADHIGPRRVLVVSVILTSIVTILSPVSVEVGDWQGLMALRILLGLAQGCFYASLHTVVALWVPSQERGLWGTLVFAGAHAGNFMSNLCSAYMLNTFRPHWQYVFYIWGGIGILWAILFFLTTYDTFRDVPTIKESEVAVLEAYYEAVSKKAKVVKTPWLAILKSLPVWAILVAMIGHDWGLFAVVVDIPKFMKSVLHMNVKENGTYVSLGYLALCILALFCGRFVDLIDKKHWVSRSWNRIIFTTIASVGPSVGLLGCSYAAQSCSKLGAVLFYVFGMCTMGTFYPSLKVNPIDLSPNHAGTIGAMGHCIGALSGILAPYLIGEMTPENTWEQWNYVWWMMFAVMSVTNVFYVFFASGEVQPWNTEGLAAEG